jgi:hypothetical protein
MTLLPGCRFAVAPLFHLPADWPRRLSIGTGVGEADGCFFPLPSWRPPTPDELSPLVARAEPQRSEDLEDCVSLFQLPGHLRAEWWQLLEQAEGALGEGRLPGFEAFVNRVGEFLAFKGLAIPEDARCDVVVSSPGQRPVGAGIEKSRPAGLLCSLAAQAPWPRAEEPGWPRQWGGINLGDEEASVVLVNLPCRQLDAELRRRFPDRPSPETVGELAGQFLRSCPDYPPVRLVLGPGEGYRLPRGGLILDGYRADRQGPDVILLISQEGRRPT